MSSLSLPRVLQQRKTSLELEREHFEKFQGVSISKAINQQETPVKEKHVRSAILGTFHEKCAETFWAVAGRLPLMENRISAWKFCHVLHKVLREGHPQALADSYRHTARVEDLGKLWGHLRDPYGKLIQGYCKLLLVKIGFHKRNPRIPGNLSLTPEELDAIGENDVNNYFQISVEMFDYMDEILSLQSAIFGSLDMSRSNSMTSSGQCRLAPLIPLVQDSSQLYDICVKFLFKLHASLPPDLLSGHRQRFLAQFRALKEFYEAASVLQYFKSLIHIPTLPDNPPNFLIQAELTSYVTPVVILPPEEDVISDTSSIATDLVDVSSTNGGTTMHLIAERDSRIEHLQNELSRTKVDVSRLLAEHQGIIRELKNRVTHLELELALRTKELEHERQSNAEMAEQAQILAQYQETEKKAKTMEEKFQKLKDVYTKLREEHIQLIRQKADVDKQLSTIQSMQLDSNEKAKLESLALELANLQIQSDAASEQNQELQFKIDSLLKEKSELELRLKEVEGAKEALATELVLAKKEASEHLARTTDIFEKVLSESVGLVERAVHEVDNPAFSSATCSIDYLRSLAPGLETSMTDLEQEVGAERVVSLAHRTAEFVILGKATSNTAPDIEFGDRMGSLCKDVGEGCLRALEGCRGTPEPNLTEMRRSLGELLEMTGRLEGMLQAGSSESVGEMVESELAAMDRAIEEAALRIQDMLNQTKKSDSGLKLQVNEKILDSCTGLMEAIRILVQKSRILQGEIVAQGKGSASVKEFYKRNHQWTEGLISAAKAVGMGATYLLEAADEVVTSGGKIERVIAAAQGISASTAQLVVASRVKADRGSASLAALTEASKGVTAATASALSEARTCTELVQQKQDDLDLTSLSLHNAKRLEMEAQVRVLELENSLTKERLRLSALRRHHYSLAPETDQPSPSPAQSL